MPDTNERIVVIDEQTGKSFTIVPESPWATLSAILSACYLLVCICGLLWLLNDTFSNHHRCLRYLCGFDKNEQLPATLIILASAFIGGGLGGILNELRSFLFWHAEHRAFGVRFIWKGIVAPWVGGSLALFAIAIVTSGGAVLGADFKLSQDAMQPAFAVFAIGALAGYGSREVSKWLDAQVKRVFSTDVTTAVVPSILNKTREDAERLLTNSGLKLGVVTEDPPAGETRVGIVISQLPVPGTTVLTGSSVNCVIPRSNVNPPTPTPTPTPTPAPTLPVG